MWKKRVFFLQSFFFHKYFHNQNICFGVKSAFVEVFQNSFITLFTSLPPFFNQINDFNSIFSSNWINYVKIKLDKRESYFFSYQYFSASLIVFKIIIKFWKLLYISKDIFFYLSGWFFCWKLLNVRHVYTIYKVYSLLH